MQPHKSNRFGGAWSSWSPWRRLTTLIVAAVVVATPVLAIVITSPEPASAPSQAWEEATEPAVEGDRVTVHVTAYTADGRPIQSSSYSTAYALNQSHGLELRNATEYQPGQFVLGSGDVGLLGPVVESYLYGARVGDRIVTDVIAANDTVTGAEGDPTSIDRRYGPFPLQETVPVEPFRMRFPNATTGDVVQLNPRFYAHVEAMDVDSVTYRYLVRDGESVPMPALGPTATLTIQVDDDRFYDVISIEEGSSFQRRNDRVLNMTHGSYLVQDVTEDQIVFQRLKAPLYDFAMQDVFFLLEVVSVEQEVSP